MLNSIDILKAVRDKLKSIYDYSVYLDDSKENCDSPCFFLSVNIYRRQAGIDKIFCDGVIHLTYFSVKGETDAVEFYRIKDDISQLFHKGFKTKDRYIKIKSINAVTDGEDADIISFDMQLEYYDVYEDKSDEKQYTIQNVGYKTEVKNYGA